MILERVAFIFRAGFLSSCLLLLGFTTSLWAEEQQTIPSLDRIQQLIKERDVIKLNISKAEAVRAELKEKEQRYISTDELLVQSEARLVKDYDSHNDKTADYNRRVANANKKCDVTTDDQSLFDYCKNIKKRHDKERAQLLNEEVTLGRRRQYLIKERENLNKAVIEWAQNKKTNEATLDYLYRRDELWLKRFRKTISGAEFDDLRIRAAKSKECAHIPGIGTLEPILDGASEKAHRCLQQIFDGAK